MKKRKVSRNLWSKVEEDTLLKCIENSNTISAGCRTAALVIDRTEHACSLHYNEMIKKTKKKSFVVKNGKNASNLTIDIKIKDDSIFITKTVGNKVVKMEL